MFFSGSVAAFSLFLGTTLSIVANFFETTFAHSSYDSRQGNSVSLPVVEIAVGWSLRQLAERSPDIKGLPKFEADELSAYLNIPVKFRYVGTAVKFEVPLTHTFTVVPHNGSVSATSVELPLIDGGIEVAFEQLAKWKEMFNRMPVKAPSAEECRRCPPVDTLALARKHITTLAEQNSSVVGIWYDGEALYSLGITRFNRHQPDKRDGEFVPSKEDVIPIFKIEISVIGVEAANELFGFQELR